MKERGVCWYNHGDRCLVRLLVSASSLRRHYGGPAALLHEGGLPGWTAAVLADLDVKTIEIPASQDWGLIRKAGAWRWAPWDHTMFLDSDTLVRAPVEEFLNAIGPHSCVVKFADWRSNGRRMGGRIKAWTKVAPNFIEHALQYGYAVNTGVMGWRRGDPLLAQYHALSARGLVPGVSRKTLDELAMQLLLPQYSHRLMDARWNASCVYGDIEQAAVIHYHGHKHCRAGAAGDLWKAEFLAVEKRWGAVAALKPGERQDRSVDKWKSQATDQLDDITIVTAVSPRYAERAERNLKRWFATPGLREQKFIVFVWGFKGAKSRAFLNHPNVRVVRWDYPHACTERERMLAAFVLGVPREVRTAYWMKLDADTAPTGDRFVWPAYRDATVTSHRWSYTKMKGDENATRHWFNRLDDAFSPQKPMFHVELSIENEGRLQHGRGSALNLAPRFASFAHIEKTSFTARMAAEVRRRCGGKLPIPSHDTLAWYCATLWGETVKTVNMKEQLNPRG